MSIFRTVKGLMAARKAYKAGEAAFTEACGLEPVEGKNGRPWDVAKTYGKASGTAATAGASVVATGGPIAAAIILARTLAPDKVPWGPDADGAVIAASTTILASLVSFVVKWRADRAAHTAK